MFLHDAIMEALYSVPVMEVKEKVLELAKVGSETGKTDYDTQFEVCGNSCITTGTKHVHLPVSVIIVELIQIWSL